MKELRHILVLLLLFAFSFLLLALPKASAQEFACIEEGAQGWEHATLPDDECCGFLSRLPLSAATGKWGSCDVPDRWEDAFVCARCGDGVCSAGETSCNCKKDCRVKTCGNKRMDGNEACDDGNKKNGDGCSSRCSIEDGWICRGAPSTCTARRGDGIVNGEEQCDDGNIKNHDGCSSSLRVEQGWTCSGTLSHCERSRDWWVDASTEENGDRRGDGIVNGEEQCDDGNKKNHDGCSSSFKVELGWTCSGSRSRCARSWDWWFAW